MVAHFYVTVAQLYVRVTHFFGRPMCLSDFCNKSVDNGKEGYGEGKVPGKGSVHEQ